MPIPGNFYTQSTYRFRSDDGSETAASWLAAENTDTTIALDTNFRIRIAVASSGLDTWTNLVWNLYYSLNGGSYTAVTASSPVKFSASSNFADGADTTNQLTKESYLNFITNNNGMKETTGGVTNSGNAEMGDGFETEWCLTLDSAQVDADDTIDFRIYRGTTALNSYNYTPRATATGDSSQNLTLTCAAGSYSLTGTNADLTVKRNYTLTCEAGSYSLTGTNADLTVKRNYVLACNAGNYLITGTDATLTVQRNYTLVCEAGSYTYTGTDISFGNTTAYTLVCEAGSYDLTGSSISFAIQRNYTFVCEAGSYSLTGTDADLVLLRNYILACEAGGYALTGTNAGLTSARTMALESGSYALTGTNADFYRALVMACNSGSYALTGSDASLTSHRIFALGMGSYVLVGTSVGLFILSPTPACRTATIEFENRTFSIPHENRTATIEFENRIFAIPHENRTATIEYENRTLEVKCH